MSARADHHLRRLVDNARSLDDAMAKLEKRGSHELGIGITRKREYSTDRGKVRLPTFGDALDALKTAITEPVLGMDHRQSLACWQILLNAPAAVLPLPDPTPDILAQQRIDVPVRDIGRLRQLVLAVVVRPGHERTDEQTLSQERFAGVAVLTLAAADHGPSARMAWLQTRWAISTREFVSDLEPQYVRAGMAGRAAGASVAVVIDEQSGLDAPEELLESLAAPAAVTGLRLKGYIRDASRHQNVLNSLQEDRPSHLIMLGSGGGMTAVAEQFRASPAGAAAGRLSEVSVVAPLEAMRERLVKIAGVSAALQPVYEPDSGFVAVPITPVDCLHDGAFLYVKDQATGLWWTRDLDNHGQIVFKTYTMVNKELRFEADRDATGNSVTEKHKGDKRRTISLSTLHRCGDPTTKPHTRIRLPDA